MTPTPTDALADYVRALADALELRDWRFRVSDEAPSNRNHVASIECIYGRKLAVLRFSDTFHANTADERRQTVVHELLHCHFHPAEIVVANVRSALGETVYGVLEGSLTDAVEVAVEAIANAVAPHMPLPEGDE